MPSDGLLLGLDAGTTRVKAVALDADGNEVAVASVATPWTSSPDGRVEAPVDAWHRAVAEVLGQLGNALGRVVGVGLAGMAESGAVFDADGRAVTPVLAWHDRRGDEQVARLEATFGDDYGRRIGQRPRPVLSVVKLGWFVEREVVCTRWLGVPELVLHALTGADATERSLAVRTGAFDVGTLEPLPDVGQALGFPVDVFAPVLQAGEVMGRVTRAGAAWSGLPEGTRVTIAGHDHLVGAAGAGARPDDLVNSVGTAETVIGRAPVLPHVGTALERRLAVTVFPGSGDWAVLASAVRAGLVMSRAAAALGSEPADLDEEAEAAPEGTAVDAAAWVETLAMCDDVAPPVGEPGDVWRGVLQALAARTADAVERVSHLVEPANRLVVFGRASRSRPWMRAKRAAVSLPVLRSTAEEAVARGAAVYAGVATGWWRDAAGAPPPQLAPDLGSSS